MNSLVMEYNRKHTAYPKFLKKTWSCIPDLHILKIIKDNTIQKITIKTIFEKCFNVELNCRIQNDNEENIMDYIMVQKRA